MENIEMPDMIGDWVVYHFDTKTYARWWQGKPIGSKHTIGYSKEDAQHLMNEIIKMDGPNSCEMRRYVPSEVEVLKYDTIINGDY